jgi:hypothetical protein
MLFIVTVYYLSHLPCRIPDMFYEELQRDNIYPKRPLWFRLVTELQITNQENHMYISYFKKCSVFGKIFMVVLCFFIFHALLHYCILLESNKYCIICEKIYFLKCVILWCCQLLTPTLRTESLLAVEMADGI